MLSRLSLAWCRCWRELPQRWPINRIDNFRHKLAAMIVTTLSLWVAAGSVLWAIAAQMRSAGVPVRLIGLIPTAAIVLLAVLALCQRAVPAPMAKNRVTWWVYLSRGLLAGVVITISVVISTYSETAGGLAAGFPAIYLTTV